MEEQIDTSEVVSAGQNNIRQSSPKLLIIAFIGGIIVASAAVGGYVLGTKNAVPLTDSVLLEEDVSRDTDRVIPTKESVESKKPTSIPSGAYLENLGPAPDFDGITEWFNSDSLSKESLKGKSVQIVFCTPTLDGSFCSAVVPYIKDWDEKYRDKGLVTIWVNTPYAVHGKFSEAEYRGQSKAFAVKYDLQFPIAQDPNNILSKSYEITGWPSTKYIDRHGNLLEPHNLRTGGGLANYTPWEEAIQLLLER